MFLLVFLALSSIFSPLRAIPYFNQIWALAMVSWFILSAIDAPMFLFKAYVYSLLVLFFFLYTVFVPYIYGNYAIGNRFFEISQLFLYYFAFNKNKYIGRPQDNLLLIKLIVPFIIVTSMLTIFDYQLNPYISRSVDNATEFGRDVLLRGVGGYELVYFLVIVMPILFIMMLNKRIIKKTKYLILVFFMILLFGYNIIQSNYATALLLMFFSLFVIIFLRKISIGRLFFYTCALMLVVIFAKQFLADVLDVIGYFSGEGLNLERIQEMRQLVLHNEIGDSLGARSFTYERSWIVILNNPIFGIIANDLNLVDGGVTGFGQHSQILDTYALFGIGIGSIQLYLFSKPFLIRLNSKNAVLNQLTLVVFLMFIFIVSINNMTTSIAFAVFFVFPTAYDWFFIKLKMNSRK
jgi:hypothetical protein